MWNAMIMTWNDETYRGVGEWGRNVFAIEAPHAV
jgi:hypothetical protein